MNRAEQARLLRSAASALEHGRLRAASKKIEEALGGPLAIFVEGGVVQDVGRVNADGFLSAPYDLVDYDVFEEQEDQDIFLHWAGLSPEVQDYIRTKLPHEYEMFQERIRNIEVSPEEAAMLERNKTY
jgi:hypothetical protein